MAVVLSVLPLTTEQANRHEHPLHQLLPEMIISIGHMDGLALCIYFITVIVYTHSSRSLAGTVEEALSKYCHADGMGDVDLWVFHQDKSKGKQNMLSFKTINSTALTMSSKFTCYVI